MPDVWAAIETDEVGIPLPVGTDPKGYTVLCSRDVWERHILARHPEVRDLRDLIVEAITAPDRSEIDPEDERVVRYYRQIPEGRRPFPRAGWVRAIVKYVRPAERQGQRTGLLSSAYIVSCKG